MVQAESISFGVLNFFQVLLGSIEEAVAERNLMLLVLSAAMPVPGIFTGAVLQPIVFDHPEHQGRLSATISNFTLKRNIQWIDDLLQPLRCVFRRQRVNARLQPCNNQRSVVDEWKVVFRPTGVMQLPQLSQANDLIGLAQTVQLVGIPQQRDASTIPQIVVCNALANEVAICLGS